MTAPSWSPREVLLSTVGALTLVYIGAAEVAARVSTRVGLRGRP